MMCRDGTCASDNSVIAVVSHCGWCKRSTNMPVGIFLSSFLRAFRTRCARPASHLVSGTERVLRSLN